jgi:hypothetical protein
MTEAKSTTPDQPAGLNVVVRSMPEKPAKPLFRDPNRLLSLAAFVFSIATGVFATYNTWRSSRETAIENVSKLTDQYYEGQSKLAQLNPSQQGYINLLRTTLRSTALRAINEASLVKTGLDEGTWLALAQINDNENNFAASQIAWKSATEATNDISVYLFGMRGLAANRLRQGDIPGANIIFGNTISAALADTFKGRPNSYSPEYRHVEAAATEAYWVSSAKAPDCAFIAEHFDNSLRQIAEAHATANLSDMGYLSMLLGTRGFLNFLRRARLSCAPVDKDLLAADDCFGVGEVIGNAPFGFIGFRGAPEKAGDADTNFLSLYYLPYATNCLVTASSAFLCDWPEKEEADTDSRATGLVNNLLACKNFTGIAKTVSAAESSSRTKQLTSLHLESGATIRITRSHWKNKDGSPAEWGVSLDVTRF